MNEANSISIVEPVPYRVFQRRGDEPRHADVNFPGEPRLGGARIRLAFRPGARVRGELRFRAVSLSDSQPGEWLRLLTRSENDLVVADIDLRAGGWYRGELEARGVDGTEASATVGPFGIGEVYLVAGQSYASNCNDEHTRIEDPEGRVSALDVPSGNWRIAHDPQPVVAQETARLGTIWPSAMNLLLPLIRVPIGMANVAVGATASRQWMPDTPLFENLLNAGHALGDFRAILWQQGESDVIENVSTDEYRKKITEIKTALDRRWGFTRPWIIAKSTFHPTAYHLPDREQAIRDAIDGLWRTPGYFPGPDTDTLGDGYRSAGDRSGHFTLAGQRSAGLLWCAALWSHLISGA